MLVDSGKAVNQLHMFSIYNRITILASINAVDEAGDTAFVPE